MSSETRRILVITVVVFALLAALGGFYLYLTGGQTSADSGQPTGPNQNTGIVPVMSIYKYGTIAIEKPVGIASDNVGNIYVTLRDGPPVLVYDRNGRFLRKFGDRGYKTGQLLSPTGIAVDSQAGRIYVADRGRLRLIAFDMNGQLQWETPVMGAVSPAVGPDGNIYVSTFGPIVVLDKQGQFVRQFGSRGKAPGQFDFPHALTVSSDGKTAYVADSNNARLEAVKPSGDATAPVEWALGTPPVVQDDPNTKFGNPSGITADSQGRLYVLDGFRYAIQLVDPKSGKSVYSWTGLQGSFNGLFQFPTNIAYMGGDSFAISDTYNDRVQIIRLLPPGQNNIIARNPWLLWLLPLLLIPLIMWLRRRRAYLTRETLDAAIEAKEFRLLAAAFKKLHILPELLDGYKDLDEDGVKFSDYLVAAKIKEQPAEKAATVESTGSVEGAPEPADDEQRLTRAAERTWLQRILFVRNPVLCVDDTQASRILEFGGTPMTLAEIEEEFELQEK